MTLGRGGAGTTDSISPRLMLVSIDASQGRFEDSRAIVAEIQAVQPATRRSSANSGGRR